MPSYLKHLIAIALLAGSVSAHAGWTSTYAQINYIQTGANGIHIYIATNENPNSCASTAWYAVDVDNRFHREVLATAYQAHALHKKVRIYTTKCTTNGKYNLIHSIRVYTPSTQ